MHDGSVLSVTGMVQGSEVIHLGMTTVFVRERGLTVGNVCTLCTLRPGLLFSPRVSPAAGGALQGTGLAVELRDLFFAEAVGNYRSTTGWTEAASCPSMLTMSQAMRDDSVLSDANRRADVHDDELPAVDQLTCTFYSVLHMAQ